MALDYVPITELEAVNVMLSTIGEAPVNTLAVSGLSDVATAINDLHRINRVVQSTGWHFNKDFEYELSPDGSGWVLAPLNAIAVDPSYDYKNYVMRGGKFWNLEDKTFIIGETVKCDIVWFFPFEDIPEPAREYVTIRAARVFQRHVLGAESIDALNREDEERAHVKLLQWEGDHSEANILNGHYISATVNRHRNPTRGYGGY